MSSKQRLAIGQRYFSEAEPELGLGIIEEITQRQITVNFRAINQTRLYSKSSAPLKRMLFQIGDEITSNNNLSFRIKKITIVDSLYIYGDQNQKIICESDLLDTVSFNRPQEKLFSGNPDSIELFNLRQKTLNYANWLSQLNCRGLIGGRISLIDHQFFIANEIVNRTIPRILLADEVGLGKTIEAGLIIHNLIITNKISKVIIIVPNTICFQWFVEMYRKFNLSFAVVNEQTLLEKDSRPFEESNLIITSIQLIEHSKQAVQDIKEQNWDMLVIDEAHSIKWSALINQEQTKKKETTNRLYNIIKDISKTIKGLLLITATPEMFGLEGHFARLKLLDPNRFFDFEMYKKEHLKYQQLAALTKKVQTYPISELYAILNDFEKSLLIQLQINLKEDPNINRSVSKEEIVNKLIDYHGTGRIYIRNSRKKMSKVYSFFPKRIHHPYPLEIKQMIKISDQDLYLIKEKWLINYLQNNHEKKVLLICQSKNLILKIQKSLNEKSIIKKIALFHSDLSLMARDRQAAYFADPLGANILLCTEIGSEGRNFEFSQNLILFDLPRNPSLLEQRIGRLDRIGQKGNVNIHIPYAKNSKEELLYCWYHHGLNAFESSTKGANVLNNKFQSELEDFFSNENISDSLLEKFQLLTKKANLKYLKMLEQFENGQDTLIEINSFNQKKALSLIEEIKLIDQSSKLKEYLDSVFTHLGVDSEDLSDSPLNKSNNAFISDIQYIKPNDNMYVTHFPCLDRDGFSLTYNRKMALQREDLTFMSWDHPLVLGVIDLIIGENYGNLTIAMRKKPSVKRSVFLETFYKLESIASKQLELMKYFPPTTVRILINHDGNDLSEKWTEDILNSKITMADHQTIQKVTKYPKVKLKKIMLLSKQHALLKSKKIKEKYILNVETNFNQEISRLSSLQEINASISIQEIDELKIKKQKIISLIEHAEVSLDSLKFIY